MAFSRLSRAAFLTRGVVGRRMASDAFAEGPSAVAGEHAGGMNRWRMLSFFMAIPACIITAIVGFREEEKEAAHGRPDYVPYPYMGIRSRKFFFGDGNHSFIHNPQTNAVPGVGYEEEWHH